MGILLKTAILSLAPGGLLQRKSKPPGRKRIFYGWWIVFAALIMNLYFSGVAILGFTSIIEPLVKEFGWSYAEVSIAASLRGLEAGFLSPLIGFLVDRWGSKKLSLAGTLLVALGFFLLSRVSTLWMFYGAYAAVSLGMSATVGTVLLTAVANWFRRSVSMATGIVSSGIGFGGVLIPIITVLIDTFQWRTAMFILSLGTLVVGLPLSLVIRHKPEPYGYLPDGRESGPSEEARQPGSSAQIGERSVSAGEALRGRTFWQLGFASMFHTFMVGVVITHIMPYLSTLGIMRYASSMIALALPVVSIAGRLGAGWLGIKRDSRHIYAAGFIILSLSTFLLWYASPSSVWLFVPFTILFSLGWGGNVTIRTVLLRQYFGRARFGTILGLCSGIQMIGNMTSAPLAGWVYDKQGSYQNVWIGVTAAGIAGLILIMTLSPPGKADGRKT